MSSHLHLLCKGTDGFILSDIMRDFKKFTSKEIVRTIQEEPESRREWMLEYFQKSCEHLKKDQKYKVWQGGYHAEIVQSNWFIKQKINYIHNKPDGSDMKIFSCRIARNCIPCPLTRASKTNQKKLYQKRHNFFCYF